MLTFKYILYVSFCLLEVTKSLGPPPFRHGEDTLELLHAVFRHGDRTPDTLYPNDPYTEDTFYPVGIGELTNPGKVKAYNIGVALRKTYGGFLGDTYTPSLIEANSSPYSRTRSTILLVLAALFRPKGGQIWNEQLLWQPIPYQYIPQEQNTLFFPNVCPNYNNLMAQSEAAFEASGRLRGYQGTIDYLLENSGLSNLSNAYLFLILHSTFKSEQEWGLPLPPWADSVWPEPLTTLAKVAWEIMEGTEELRPLNGGFLVGKIINDTYAKIGNLNPAAQKRKIYLYSGHDSNIAGVLSWLGVFTPHSPAYGSYITFEIHNVGGTRYIQIFHQNYDFGLPVQILIPKCGPICRLDVFVSLYAQYFDTSKYC